MSCGCRKNNGCGCQRAEERRGCGCNNMQVYDDFLDIFESQERDLGPHTWNGYVWYDIEVSYTGPYFGSYRRPEPRGCGCQRAEERRGCGCNR